MYGDTDALAAEAFAKNNKSVINLLSESRKKTLQLFESLA
jgi:hypothetical protein